MLNKQPFEFSKEYYLNEFGGTNENVTLKEIDKAIMICNLMTYGRLLSQDLTNRQIDFSKKAVAMTIDFYFENGDILESYFKTYRINGVELQFDETRFYKKNGVQIQAEAYAYLELTGLTTGLV